MKHHSIDPAAATPAEPADAPAAADVPATRPEPVFAPVVLRRRHDGWTPERQFAFIEKLADCGSVADACAFVGMSRESARQLRRRPHARAFRDAWDAALDCSMAEVEESAAQRARYGVARPIFYKGEQVGEWRHFDERLTMFLLRMRRRHRFGPEGEQPPSTDLTIAGRDPDELLPPPFDPEVELGGRLDAMEFAPDPPADENEDGDGEAGPA